MPLSLLLFIIVLHEVIKECREQGYWDLLYADDLVLTAGSKEEGLEMFSRWREDMEQRGLKIYIGKKMGMVIGKEPERILETINRVNL